MSRRLEPYLIFHDIMECPGGSLRVVLQLCEGLMPSKLEGKRQRRISGSCGCGRGLKGMRARGGRSAAGVGE